MAFWRRSKGRHALGAAVTAIPAAPRPVAPVPQQPVAQPVAHPAPTFLPAATPPPIASQLPPPIAPPPAPEPVPVGPRVELTFRDGSSASLDPTQARALDEIAQVLTRRDEVKH
jgi:hypothetical protein